jgi:Dolichyl-phosphate-mannose-protein mannosyltransferase
MTPATTATPSTRATWAWLLVIALLLAVRLPSLVEPAGGDQGLYGYAGQRVLAGAIPYVDVWDQKPPGIALVYALLWRIWPHESAVAAADIAAAAAVAILLVQLGRRRFSAHVGYGAAALFLLLGDPSLQRNSGVYVRGQCEPFIALAASAALVVLAGPTRRRWHLVLAGVCLAAAFWLKYNAIAYGLPAALAVWAWRPREGRVRGSVTELLWMGLGFAGVVAGVGVWLASRGALTDLYLATIAYNLQYSGETYRGLASLLAYLVVLPFDRARVDLLWYLGGVGSLLLAWRRRDGSALVVLGWLAAAIASIAINGGRNLPNYFVQANPALALAAAAGLAGVTGLAGRTAWIRYAVAALVAAGLWRVGDEPTRGLRLGGLPGLVENVRYDLGYAWGDTDRTTYLSRFTGQKFDAAEIDALVQYVRTTTAPSDPVFVFGFSGGSVCWRSRRVSASRFFWSEPVIAGFAVDRPGYGPAGLLADLRRSRPIIVALQKEQWHSRTFFMDNEGLRTWLEQGYVVDHDTPMFEVWRRKS